MNTDWQTFLTQSGASIDEGRVVDFGDPELELKSSLSKNVLCDLSSYSVLLVEGEDAETFLQGQFSNDIKLVKNDSCQFSSWNTAKGRMLANFVLWRDDSGFYLQLPASLRESIQKRLTMFLLRAKVKITDVSDQLVRLGVAGKDAEALVTSAMGQCPQADYGVAQNSKGSTIKLAGNIYEIVTTPEQAPELWKALLGNAVAVSTSRWEWHLIQAGIPVIAPATQEQFVPQMVNFELINGVNFKKGCYPGQEIVARTQYLGKLKRRMYLAHLEAKATPGDELYSADLPEQSTGMIVNAQASPEGGYDVLAVIQMSSAESQEIHFQSIDGPTLKLKPLPYNVP